MRTPGKAVRAALVAMMMTAVLGAGPALPASAARAPRPFPVGAKVDYQLGGAYKVPRGVRIVVRDMTARPAKGAYNICYVNGFQTQPGSRWLTTHPSLVLRTAKGKPIADPGWPDEYLLDTSTASKRKAIARVIHRYLSRCAKAGFDAVEVDNLDSYSRSRGRLTLGDNLALAKRFIADAHRLKLRIAQKNTVELGRRGKKAGFDFVVAEDCAVYRECGDYLAVYGKKMIEIEYTDVRGFSARMATACRQRGKKISIVGRDRDLTTPSDPSYRFRTC